MNDNEALIEHAYYEPRLNQDYRILVRFSNSWVPLVWFAFHKDASFYIGTSQKIQEISTIDSLRATNGKLNVKYAEAVAVDTSSIINPGKTSFHGSGAINSLGQRRYREKILNISKQDWICDLMFKHPRSQQRTIKDNDVRNTDICLNYPLDDERPLTAAVYVEPTSQHSPLRAPQAVYQVNLCFEYEGVEGDTPNATVQIIMSHSIKGTWSPVNSILYPMAKKRTDI